MSSHPTALLPAFEFRASLQALQTLLLPASKAQSRAIPVAVHPTGKPDFELVEHVGGERSSVETFISERFAECFGSRIEAFMPRLFSLRNREGDICGAFGLRSANRNLFLEQYLDTPIEKTIASHAGAKVERQTIVEVGHFSGTFPGSARAMIGLLTQHLHRDGIEWVVFTGTTELRNAFYRLGLCPIDVQAATADRLPAGERAAWGSYYEHGPRVLVGNVLEGYRAMHQPIAPSRLQPEEHA